MSEHLGDTSIDHLRVLHLCCYISHSGFLMDKRGVVRWDLKFGTLDWVCFLLTHWNIRHTLHLSL